jgi:hypothetical protein
MGRTNVYGDSSGFNHFCIWRMWLGRCYDVTDFAMADVWPHGEASEVRNWPVQGGVAVADQHEGTQ